MSFLRRRQADRIYREGGWGPRLTWPAPRRPEQVVETRYGALSLAFKTANTDMFGDFGRSMFSKIVETAFLGARPDS